MTIVNASDIFGKFFDVKFFILENVIPQMPLSVIYLYTVRDLCYSEPGYLRPKRDNSYVRCLG